MIFKRNNILKFINFPFIIENIPLKERITVLNNKPINDGKIIYLMTREFRFYDNLAINYTISEAKKHNLNYKVLYIYPEFNTKNKQNFFQNNFLKLKKTFLKEGKINRYLRIYWAKMILKWSTSNYEAIKRAIYLNDKYAFDAPSTNGYTSILWAIGGLHDRAFIERQIFGKVRIMTQKGISSKFNINEYIKKYQQ